jgi:hypothetical protein
MNNSTDMSHVPKDVPNCGQGAYEEGQKEPSQDCPENALIVRLSRYERER